MILYKFIIHYINTFYYSKRWTSVRRAMLRRRLLGARPGTVFVLQELYFRKRLPSRLYRARVRIKIHSEETLVSIVS